MVYREKFIVAVKSHGKILRETHDENGDSKVTIPFGSEYQILLKNLEARPALVNIAIDGADVAGSIIIQSNNSLNLEGFLKDLRVTHKFKFIEKTEQISNYRGDRLDDSLIRVQYTFEKCKPQIVNDYHYHHNYYDWGWYWPWHYPHHHHHHDIIWETNLVKQNSSGERSQTTTDGPTVQTFSCNNSPNVQVNFCNSINDQGITVPGSRSEQVFVPGYVGELETNSHCIVIRLIGMKNGKKVEKIVHTKTKLQCHTCGKKSKSNNEFCSRCGTALF